MAGSSNISSSSACSNNTCNAISSSTSVKQINDGVVPDSSAHSTAHSTEPAKKGDVLDDKLADFMAVSTPICVSFYNKLY